MTIRHDVGNAFATYSIKNRLIAIHHHYAENNDVSQLRNA
jgi:hypothetical protein